MPTAPAKAAAVRRIILVQGSAPVSMRPDERASIRAAATRPASVSEPRPEPARGAQLGEAEEDVGVDSESQHDAIERVVDGKAGADEFALA